jgi:hypothetical protein
LSAPTLFWFHFAIFDSPLNPLSGAASEKRGPVVAVFTLDPALYGPAGLPRRSRHCTIR